MESLTTRPYLIQAIIDMVQMIDNNIYLILTVPALIPAFLLIEYVLKRRQ